MKRIDAKLSARARYDAESDTLRISLKRATDARFEIGDPRSMIQGLDHATQTEIEDVRYDPIEGVLEWKRAGVSMPIFGFLDLFFGAGVVGRAIRQDWGRRGGSRTSERKAEASRANGRLGGRPRSQE